MTRQKRGEPFSVLTPMGRRIIGEITWANGKLVLVKKVRREAHFHRFLQAWGLQASAIPQLREMGVAAVRLVVDDGSVLEASLGQIDRFGFKREFPPHGEQVFLPERYWVPVQPPKGQPRQLRLFDPWQVAQGAST